MAFPGTLRSVLFVDVETTGLFSSDRIVSLGAILLFCDGIQENILSYKWSHLIFDPMKKSHPRAEAVHGFDDWILRHQEPFAKRANLIHMMIEYADLIVAHNAEFDMGFIWRELELAGFSRPSRQVFCTMRAYRENFPGAASLDKVCAQFGVKRCGDTHGALEDAWLAMQVFLWLNGCPLFSTPFTSIENPALQNFIMPPPAPDGKLPRRRNRAKKLSV